MSQCLVSKTYYSDPNPIGIIVKFDDDPQRLETRIQEEASKSNMVILENALFPPRSFRNYWKLSNDNQTLIINWKFAKPEYLDYIRSFRNKELSRLDVLMMRAIEEDDLEEKPRLLELKKALRDLPKKVDDTWTKLISLDKTDQEIYAYVMEYWPEELANVKKRNFPDR